MTDNSKFWRELDPSTQNYCLENDIKKAEKKMREANELQEQLIENMLDKGNYNRLKGIEIGKMSWQDVELYNEIKKKYSNTNKSYDGSDLSDTPKPEGYEPDNTNVKEQMMGGLISIKQAMERRGYQVPQLKPMSSLTDVLQNVNAIRDSLKGQISPEPVSQAEIEEESPEPRYTKAELLSTKQAIDEMLANGEYVEG